MTNSLRVVEKVGTIYATRHSHFILFPSPPPPPVHSKSLKHRTACQPPVRVQEGFQNNKKKKKKSPLTGLVAVLFPEGNFWTACLV